MAEAPLLTTERLVLRAQRLEDFEPFAAIFASPRSVHMGGPLTRRDAWLSFAADSGTWQLLGLGCWTVERRADASVVGQIGVNKPDFFPEVELGWLLYSGFTGQGYATEAASAARDWALGPRGLETLVSYIDPENATSVALAERLGAQLDPQGSRPEPGTLVYRHPGRGDRR